MVVLVGDGSRKKVSFIVCKLPPGKEPLLNVETSMALGALPHQFPEWDYSTGRKYEEQDIVHIFGGTGAFDMDADGREDEPEYDELGFNIKKSIQRIERESTEKGRTMKEMKERLEREWASKVLSDSLEGSCINMQPSKIKYRMPKDKDEWRKVKRRT